MPHGFRASEPLRPRHLELSKEPHVRSGSHFILEVFGDEEVEAAHQVVPVDVAAERVLQRALAVCYQRDA